MGLLSKTVKRSCRRIPSLVGLAPPGWAQPQGTAAMLPISAALAFSQSLRFMLAATSRISRATRLCRPRQHGLLLSQLPPIGVHGLAVEQQWNRRNRLAQA